MTTAGTSNSSTQPAWASILTVGNTIADGTVVWTNTARPSVTLNGIGTNAPFDTTNMPSTFANVVMYLGQAQLSQQLLDRQQGNALDQAIAKQIAREIATQQNSALVAYCSWLTRAFRA